MSCCLPYRRPRMLKVKEEAAETAFVSYQASGMMMWLCRLQLSLGCLVGWTWRTRWEGH